MEYLYYAKKLKDLFRQYYNVTNIRIAFLDLSFKDIVSYPDKRSPICEYIRTNKDADNCCKECDKRSCRISKERQTVYGYYCHAGLYEMIVPLKINDSIIGYLFFAHMLKGKNKKEIVSSIIEKTKPFNLDPNRIREASKECRIVSEEYIESSVFLLNTIATYICMESLGLFKKKDPLIIKIEKYISDHISEDIRIDDVCKEIGVGRTKLYTLSQRYLDQSFHKYVLTRKMNYAKTLLLDEELSVYEVALKVGFTDYNYFISTFRRETGISPHKYRTNK